MNILTHRLSSLPLAAVLLLLSPPAGWAGGSTRAGDAAGLRLGALFQDHMVLQRDMPVKVWGWADEGEKVTVEFAGQKQTATTGEDGRWIARLDPMGVSTEGRTMTVQSASGNRRASIEDVLVGEVWVCSGQSNMQYTMARFPNCAADVPGMNYPMIRHFAVLPRDSAIPAEDVLGVWSVCSPETADQFSAAALMIFTRTIHSPRPNPALWITSPRASVPGKQPNEQES